uniref:Uncharacterized protein n=1 Tax=viral metagenome TaxID=1070528 RepID=A0A6C0D8T1_9ZZZZ
MKTVVCLEGICYEIETTWAIQGAITVPIITVKKV